MTFFCCITNCSLIKFESNRRFRIMRALILIWIPWFVFAQIGDDIPADRVVDWQYAGYGNNTTDIPYAKKTICIDDSKGALEDYSDEINTAIAAADGNILTEIYLPARTYYLEHPIKIDKSNIILRGAGPNETKLVSRGFSTESEPLIKIFGNKTPYPSIDVHDLENLEKGSQYITVHDPSQFQPGCYAEIYQPNGSWNKKDDTWDDFSVGQIVKIESIIGDEFAMMKLKVSEEDKIRLRFYDSNSTEATMMRRIFPIVNVGIEDLYINGLSYDYELFWNDKFFNIDYNYAVGCWITNVYSQRAGQAHVRINRSSEILIHGCYFREAVHYGNGGYGYGIEISNHSGRCLIENNIFWYLRHAMLVQLGANGNVFGYNYSGDPHPDDIGDAICHGNYAFANLFEGNYYDMPRIDYEQDTNGPNNTFFRNHNADYSFDSKGMIAVNWVYNLNTPHWLDDIWNTFVRTSTNDFSYYLGARPDFMADYRWPYSPWTGVLPAWQRAGSLDANCVSVKDKPRIPKNFTINTNNGHPELTWSRNYETSIRGYEIWRKTSYNWSRIATTINTVYIDRSATTVFDYYDLHYRIRAADSSNVKSNFTDTETVKGMLPRLYSKVQDSEVGRPMLLPNSPNPFNPVTNILFFLPEASYVVLNIYNVRGELVSTLGDGFFESGYHRVQFNGDHVSSGIYIYKITTNKFTEVKRMLLVK